MKQKCKYETKPKILAIYIFTMLRNIWSWVSFGPQEGMYTTKLITGPKTTLDRPKNSGKGLLIDL